MVYKTSKAGLDLLKQFEGLKTVAYVDSVGVYTIGYGTIMYPNGVRVKKGDTCTKEQAEQYLTFKLNEFENAINKLLKVPVTQNQFDAMVCLTYNIGIGGFSGSSVLRRVNEKNFKSAADAFLMWNKGRVKGVLQPIQGLTNRRNAERLLFLK